MDEPAAPSRRVGPTNPDHFQGQGFNKPAHPSVSSEASISSSSLTQVAEDPTPSDPHDAIKPRTNDGSATSVSDPSVRDSILNAPRPVFSGAQASSNDGGSGHGGSSSSGGGSGGSGCNNNNNNNNNSDSSNSSSNSNSKGITSNINNNRSNQTTPTMSPPKPQRPVQHCSNSQDTSASRAFADPGLTQSINEGGHGNSLGTVRDSSQESQLMQLSHLVSAQERMPVPDSYGANSALSRKRMADGVVKHTREHSDTSPIFNGGHSRNPSAVSITSTASSRIGELSSELKTRLSYAMVKVNQGWESHAIDQIESLASQAASPASSTSTVHLRHASSASPRLSNSPQLTSSTVGVHRQLPGRSAEAVWRVGSQMRTQQDRPVSPVKSAPALAPPVSIQPSRPLDRHPRRNSNVRGPPALIASTYHASPGATPHTPGQASPYMPAHQRTPLVDNIHFSPHQSPHQAVREQDAMEALIFMRSPGNSANLKHAFPQSSSQPIAPHAGSQRTALPGSQPRKSLPSSKPLHHYSQSQPTPKRVGFERSPVTMDVDEPYGSPRGATRRRTNAGEQHPPHTRLKNLPLSVGLGALSSKPRRALAEEDFNRMLDTAAAAEQSSDSEGEIQIPRREEARAVGA